LAGLVGFGQVFAGPLKAIQGLGQLASFGLGSSNSLELTSGFTGRLVPTLLISCRTRTPHFTKGGAQPLLPLDPLRESLQLLAQGLTVIGRSARVGRLLLQSAQLIFGLFHVPTTQGTLKPRSYPSPSARKGVTGFPINTHLALLLGFLPPLLHLIRHRRKLRQGLPRICHLPLVGQTPAKGFQGLGRSRRSGRYGILGLHRRQRGLQLLGYLIQLAGFRFQNEALLLQKLMQLTTAQPVKVGGKSIEKSCSDDQEQSEAKGWTKSRPSQFRHRCPLGQFVCTTFDQLPECPRPIKAANPKPECGQKGLPCPKSFIQFLGSLWNRQTGVTGHGPEQRKHQGTHPD
jgi:hypothetical protein